MKEKHGILLFLTSCLSGCGQMYQGNMKRGISMLLLFFTLLAVAGFLSMPPVAFFLPVVWLYAFFDSYNLRSRIAGGNAPEDEFLFGLSELDSQRMAALLRKRHSIIGWVLVALGVYMLYDILMNQLDFFFGGWFGSYLYSLLRYDLPRLVVTVLVIWLGVWFLRGAKAKSADEDLSLIHICRDAKAVYDRIAAAEAKAHGIPLSEVHFHEVGSCLLYTSLLAQHPHRLIQIELERLGGPHRQPDAAPLGGQQNLHRLTPAD